MYRERDRGNLFPFFIWGEDREDIKGGTKVHQKNEHFVLFKKLCNLELYTSLHMDEYHLQINTTNAPSLSATWDKYVYEETF